MLAAAARGDITALFAHGTNAINTTDAASGMVRWERERGTGV